MKELLVGLPLCQTRLFFSSPKVAWVPRDDFFIGSAEVHANAVHANLVKWNVAKVVRMTESGHGLVKLLTGASNALVLRHRLAAELEFAPGKLAAETVNQLAHSFFSVVLF